MSSILDTHRESVGPVTPELEPSPLILLYPGQGPDPRVLSPMSKSLQAAYTEVTGIQTKDVPDLTDEAAYSGEIAQPLHIIRTAAAYEQLNIALEQRGVEPISERPGLVREPASLSEYLAFSHVGAWDIHTSLEAARQRGKYSDELAARNNGTYGMMATFYTAVMRGTDPGERPLQATLRDILGSNGSELAQHEVISDVFIGSYASESLITLTGLISALEKVQSALRPYRRTISSKMLGRINGAYHSPFMRVVQEQMAEFIANTPTRDPDPDKGVLYSPTSGQQVRTAEDVQKNASDLLVLPVDQLLVFGGIWKSLHATNIATLPVIEVGNSRDYPWGTQQGVQTACIYDYALYHPLTNSQGQRVQLDTITFNGTGADAQSDSFLQFTRKHLGLR